LNELLENEDYLSIGNRNSISPNPAEQHQVRAMRIHCTCLAAQPRDNTTDDDVVHG
jgi:hypothetical protein